MITPTPPKMHTYYFDMNNFSNRLTKPSSPLCRFLDASLISSSRLHQSWLVRTMRDNVVNMSAFVSSWCPLSILRHGIHTLEGR